MILQPLGELSRFDIRETPKVCFLSFENDHEGSRLSWEGEGSDCSVRLNPSRTAGAGCSRIPALRAAADNDKSMA